MAEEKKPLPGEAVASDNAGKIDVPDPFDPATVRIDPAEAAISVERVYTHIPARRPDRQEWFTTRGEEEFRVDTTLLFTKEDGATYLVAPNMRSELAEEQKLVTLFTAMNRGGQLFLLPVRLPDLSGRRDSWSESARKGAELAMTGWVRLSSNRAIGAYEIFKAKSGVIPAPEWPPLSMQELLRLAFGEAIIDSPDHPIVRRLRGLA